MRQCTCYFLSILTTAFYAAAHWSSTDSGCPLVWEELASDLGTFFVEDGTCSDAARAAIRLAFHDCFPGRCDGSIILADECTDRGENAQMVDICSTLGEKAEEWGVGTADIIQFAAAIGMASCSGGPITSFYAGRVDNYNESPIDAMPTAQTDATTMVNMFAAKNFSVTELVALTGAHSIGRQLDGTPMDSTIGEWDHKFYGETRESSAPESVAADLFMSKARETGHEWKAVGRNQQTFHDAFIPAMEKLSLMGHCKDDLVDCSEVVESYAGSANVRRRVLLKGRRTE